MCLVEAGPDSARNPFVHVPLAVGFLVSYNPFSNWNYDTVSQKHLGNRPIFWPRGKMLGGSSSMNGMVYQRGHARDYDMWAELGNEGWSYQDMLPYFKKLECWEPGLGQPKSSDDAMIYHGQDGPVRVSSVPSPNPLARLFVESGHNAGLPLNDDFNGADQEGVGLNQWTASKGFRCSTAAAYLSSDVRARSNLTVLTNSPVAKVTFADATSDDPVATGVELADGSSTRISASREVILCGGAVNSPQILMHSGVGPSKELAKHGIETIRNVQGVGKNLQDHLNLAITCRESTSMSYGLSPGSVHRWLLSPFQLLFKGEGMLTSTFAEGGGFAKTRAEKDIPDIQFHFYPSKIKRQMEISSILGHGFSLQTCLLRPKSKGEVRLRSADPKVAPIIDPNYLDDEDDVQVFVDGFKLMRRILKTTPLSDHVAEELNPGPAVHTDEEIREFVRDNATTIFHPTGTCKMGTKDDPLAVVDEELKVRGVKRLRVVDASIMPEIVGANTNVPAIAIGEKGADLCLSAV